MAEQDTKIEVEVSVHDEPASSSEDSTMRAHLLETEQLGITIISLFTKIKYRKI